MDHFSTFYNSVSGSQPHSFTFDNPISVDTTARVEQVLLSQDTSSQKARKLFLLERLHTTSSSPTSAPLPPPPVKEQLLDSSEAWEKANRASIRNSDAAKRVTAARGLRKHKTAHKPGAVVHNYDPNETALGIDAATSSSGFYDFRDVMQSQEISIPLR